MAITALSARPEIACAETGDRVVQVYVIQRPINRQLLKNLALGSLTHSALLLKTESGEHYTLEYMNDSKVHLTKGRENVVKEYQDRRKAEIEMRGLTTGGETLLKWERPLEGDELTPKWTPVELQGKMQALMKTYSVWQQEHCHTAQKRLRKEIGL